MQLQVQDLRDQLAMVRGVFALTDEQSVLRDQDAARLQKRLDSCVVLASELGLPSAATARLNNTDVITWAAKHVHRQDEPLLASGVQLLWRTGSAAAHGQRSFAMTRLDRNSQRTDDGGTVMELRGDLARDVGPSAAAATFTISEALRLYDSRNGA
ncbi:hypothetical protein DEJ04_17370 [Curtobacterium sp. MCLR17_044]|nr:hypothetical protein DEJ04_17370 [Curtobacterium sp. MCLR17_044]